MRFETPLALLMIFLGCFFAAVGVQLWVGGRDALGFSLAAGGVAYAIFCGAQYVVRVLSRRILRMQKAE